MIFEIIMNNPGRYKYMSKNKDTVSVCLIDLGGGNIQKNKQVFYLRFVAKKKTPPINDITMS